MIFRSSRGLRLVNSPTKPKVTFPSGNGGGEEDGVAVIRGLGEGGGVAVIEGSGVVVAVDVGGKV